MPIHSNMNRRLASVAALACAMSIAMLPTPASAVITPVQSDAEINNATSLPATGPFAATVADPAKLVVSRNSYVGTKEFVSNVLLAFPLSMLPAGTTGADVVKATMFLWIREARASLSDGDRNVIDFAAITSGWTEASASLKTQPPVGAAFGSLDVRNLAAGQYIAVDLTPQVRAWLGSPGSNFGIMLSPDPRGPADFNVSISSRESTDHPPIVDITLAGHGSPDGGATIQVGVTSTGAPGTAAVVTNRGSNTAAVLDFTIPRGDRGPAGVPGAPGAAGAPGANGKTIRSGASGPSAGDGVDGDFFINTSTNMLFGPKAVGNWPATGVSLVGPAGPIGPSGTRSIAVDINNKSVPFGFHQLLGSYTLTNSEGIVAKVGSFTNIAMKMPGEQVPRQVVVITGGTGQLFFPTAKCTGNVGYVSGSSLSYNDSNGIATLDDAAAVNTDVTLSFWRFDMGTPPTPDFQPLSVRNANGTCATVQPTSPPAKLASALQLVRSEPVTFLNALWPVRPWTAVHGDAMLGEASRSKR